jgi:hypothetical protein
VVFANQSLSWIARITPTFAASSISPIVLSAQPRSSYERLATSFFCEQ